MTETIPVRIDRETLDTIDLLVRIGLYSTRSQAMRELMKKGIESQHEVKKLGKLVKLIERLDLEGKLDFSGLELQRDRFSH